MHDPDDSLKKLTNQAVISYTRSKDNKVENNYFRLALLGVFAIVAAEWVKVIYRKDFGSNALNFYRLLACSSWFMAVGIVSLVFAADGIYYEELPLLGDSYRGRLYSGFLFIGLSLFILGAGLLERWNGKRKIKAPGQEGKSHILGFLRKDGWAEPVIRNFFEPFFTLAIGGFLCLFNLAGGISVMFCAISVWLCLIIEPILKRSALQASVKKMNDDSGRSDQFNEIKNN